MPRAKTPSASDTNLSRENGQPTLTYENPDPNCRLNVAREEQLLKTRTALSVNRTSIGQSVAVDVRAL